MISFTIITLFPEFFESPLKVGLLGKAIQGGKVRVHIVDLKGYAGGWHHRCDDYPYGGGSGMVLRCEPLAAALDEVKGDLKVILTSASGKPLTQQMVKKFYEERELCIICGHYEGVDQRIVDMYVDYEISIGDFVLSGGEYAALCIIDAVSRYEPGFMANPHSLVEESFEDGLLEYPHYTRPEDFRGLKVPQVLLSGNHAEIARWRREKRIEKTRSVRPDLYERYLLSNTKGDGNGSEKNN
ncbi:MAG: tRNA (guanosine(37)-N1)-methyltransferase TrmD [Spirochaetes bacterium]|nr:tRNA (guanosine(37)-N1)-methyltransferase TrmD [Spirochaetota bacterium]